MKKLLIVVTAGLLVFSIIGIADATPPENRGPGAHISYKEKNPVAVLAKSSGGLGDENGRRRTIPVPEPASFITLSLGVIVLAAARRKFQR